MKPKDITDLHRIKIASIRGVIDKAVKCQDVNHFLGYCSEIERRARETHADICAIKQAPIAVDDCGDACRMEGEE
jgi:hypothetical protein